MCFISLLDQYMIILKPDLRALDDVQRKCVQQFISDMYTAGMLDILFNTPADSKSSLFAPTYLEENPSALFEYCTSSKGVKARCSTASNAYSSLAITSTSDSIPYATWRKRDLHTASIKVIKHTKAYMTTSRFPATNAAKEAVKNVGVYPVTSVGIADMVASTDYAYHSPTDGNSLPIDTMDNPWVLLTYPKFSTPEDRIPPMYVWFAKYNVLLSVCKTYDSEFQVGVMTISSTTQDHNVMVDDNSFGYVADRSSFPTITDVFNSTDPDVYDVYSIRNRGVRDMLTTRQMFTSRVYKIAQTNANVMISNQTDPYTHGTPEGDTPLEFLCGTEEKLVKLIETIVYAHIPYRTWGDCQVAALPITVRAAVEQDSENAAEIMICDWLGEVNDMFTGKYVTDNIRKRMQAALDVALDQNYPVGFSWEYNDGISNKMSGYSETPRSIDLDVSAPSAHDYMGSILEFNTWAEVSMGKSALLHVTDNDNTASTNVPTTTEHHG